MSSTYRLGRLRDDFVTAVQFLTRIPIHTFNYEPDSLARAVKFFPFVGGFLGAIAALLHSLLVPHIGRVPAALCVVIMLVWSTGCLHEDGLADTADGLGGGKDREQILLIFRDSRIGTYGATALALGLLARVILIASVPLNHVAQTLIASHILCRWTTLPLSYFLAPARVADGQGARIAQLTSLPSLLWGTLFSLVAVGFLLEWRSLAAIAAAMLITFMSGRLYNQKINGVTGDCFGATNQLTEISVYLCGTWTT